MPVVGEELLGLADGGDKDFDIERLGECRAGVQTARDLHYIRPSTDHDDRGTGSAQVRPPTHNKLGPAHDGESQIHDDDIWLIRHRKTQRMLPVDGTDRLVASLAKGELEKLTDRIVILNNQDPEHSHGARLRSIISQIWTPWRHSDDRSRAHLLAGAQVWTARPDQGHARMPPYLELGVGGLQR